MEIYIGNITDSRSRVRQEDLPVTPARPKREGRKALSVIVVTLSIKKRPQDRSRPQKKFPVEPDKKKPVNCPE